MGISVGVGVTVEDGDALGVGVGMMVIVGDGARLGIGVGLGSEAGLHAANVIIRKIITAAVPDLIQPHLFSNFMTYPLSYAPITLVHPTIYEGAPHISQRRASIKIWEKPGNLPKFRNTPGIVVYLNFVVFSGITFLTLPQMKVGPVPGV